MSKFATRHGKSISGPKAASGSEPASEWYGFTNEEIQDIERSLLKSRNIPHRGIKHLRATRTASVAANTQHRNVSRTFDQYLYAPLHQSKSLSSNSIALSPSTSPNSKFPIILPERMPVDAFLAQLKGMSETHSIPSNQIDEETKLQEHIYPHVPTFSKCYAFSSENHRNELKLRAQLKHLQSHQIDSLSTVLYTPTSSFSNKGGYVAPRADVDYRLRNSKPEKIEERNCIHTRPFTAPSKMSSEVDTASLKKQFQPVCDRGPVVSFGSAPRFPDQSQAKNPKRQVCTRTLKRASSSYNTSLDISANPEIVATPSDKPIGAKGWCADPVETDETPLRILRKQTVFSKKPVANPTTSNTAHRLWNPHELRGKHGSQQI